MHLLCIIDFKLLLQMIEFDLNQYNFKLTKNGQHFIGICIFGDACKF